MHLIDFVPPLSGFENTFNTFRIGVAWSKRLAVGDVVGLVDKKNCKLFGVAEVTGVHIGKLGEMACLHAAQNHNQLHLEPAEAPDRIKQNLLRLYGPQIVNDDKKTTVIELRRLTNDGYVDWKARTGKATRLP